METVRFGGFWAGMLPTEQFVAARTVGSCMQHEQDSFAIDAGGNCCCRNTYTHTHTHTHTFRQNCLSSLVLDGGEGERERESLYINELERC